MRSRRSPGLRVRILCVGNSCPSCGIRILPGPSRSSSVDRGGVLAYSCAAARDLHPLPCPCVSAEIKTSASGAGTRERIESRTNVNGARVSVNRAEDVTTANPSLTGKKILVDLTVLHDDDKVFLGICNQIDVGDRVAVNKQQISEGALLHHAEFARIWIAFAGHCQ